MTWVALGMLLSGVARADKPAVHWIHHLVPYNLRVRRPTGYGADPTAEPGAPGYLASPLPGPGFECQDMAWLFRDLKIAELRACVLSVKPGTTVDFRLKRQAQPVLEIAEPKKAPECLVALASNLPVPREIVFESNDEGAMRCYSARIGVTADEFLGAKVPARKVAVRVRFPTDPAPADDDQMRMLLFTWILAPYWEEKPRQFKAHLVTDAACDACMGRKNRVRAGDAPPPLWP